MLRARMIHVGEKKSVRALAGHPRRQNIHGGASPRSPRGSYATAINTSQSLPPSTLLLPTTSQTTYTPTWSRQTHPVTITPFTTAVGPTFDVPEAPVDVFLHFWPDAFLQQICTQTNLYAQQVMGPAKYVDWVEVSVPELKAYLGFSILMGIVKLPALEDYWKVDPFLHFPPIASRISRQRFRDISRYLHFVDNTQLACRGHPGYDKLGRCDRLLTTAAGCSGRATTHTVNVQQMRL